MYNLAMQMISDTISSLPVHVMPALQVACISLCAACVFFYYITFTARTDREGGGFVGMLFAIMSVPPFLVFSIIALLGSVVAVIRLGDHPYGQQIRWICAAIALIVIVMDSYFLRKLSKGRLR